MKKSLNYLSHSPLRDIHTKLGLRRYLESVCHGVKFYTEYPDTIFSINGHDIARWNYDLNNYTVLDPMYFEL